jgi:serine/threonine-protein kinase
MRAALADAADALPPPGPIPVAGMHDGDDPNPTRTATSGAALFDQDAADALVAPQILPMPQPEPDGRRHPGERRLVPFVVAVVLLLTVGLAAAALAHVGGASPIAAPTLSGLPYPNAISLAQREGFRARVGPTRASSDPAGIVIGQSPDPGDFTTSRHITLTVSSGPPPVRVPNVVGQQWSAAQPALDAAGFIITKKDAYDETSPAGVVVKVDPAAGQNLAPESKVTVTVSKGHAPVNVPDVTGKSFDDASTALTAAHFKVVRAGDQFSNSQPAGAVISTNPAANEQAAYGSTVTVVVSKGPDRVTVPDLHNLTLSDATKRLHTAGLEVGTIKGWNSDSDTVVGQNVKAQTKALLGSKVDLSFSSPSIIQCILTGNC